jgi:hypothetical protein
MFVDCLSTSAFTSMVIVELIWICAFYFADYLGACRYLIYLLVVLWVLWVATAADAAHFNAIDFGSNCSIIRPVLRRGCRQVQTLEGFSFIIWIMRKFILIFVGWVPDWQVLNASFDLLDCPPDHGHRRPQPRTQHMEELRQAGQFYWRQGRCSPWRRSTWFRCSASHAAAISHSGSAPKRSQSRICYTAYPSGTLPDPTRRISWARKRLIQWFLAHDTHGTRNFLSLSPTNKSIMYVYTRLVYIASLSINNITPMSGSGRERYVSSIACRYIFGDHTKITIRFVKNLQPIMLYPRKPLTKASGLLAVCCKLRW